MNYVLILFISLMVQEANTLFQFTANTDPLSWTVVNDGVMGGLSKGRLTISDEGRGIFQTRRRQNLMVDYLETPPILTHVLN
ncbi:CIA30 family protein [uncultured Muriicola sp.]|uniref:CIA30 family protein n=1 Tax=uncultured Muriicola sp. TaxID=1583102 RepID=UPI00345BCE01